MINDSYFKNIIFASTFMSVDLMFSEVLVESQVRRPRSEDGDVFVLQVHHGARFVEEKFCLLVMFGQSLVLGF